MATLKSDKAQDGVQPREVHAGSNSVKAVYSITASLNAGDVIQMVKIPDNAVIDDIRIDWGNVGASVGTVRVGDGGSAGRFVSASASVSANTGIQIMANNMGYQYNLSDAAGTMWDTIDITVDSVTAATATGNVTMTVTYHMDEAEA